MDWMDEEIGYWEKCPILATMMNETTKWIENRKKYTSTGRGMWSEFQGSFIS